MSRAGIPKAAVEAAAEVLWGKEMSASWSSAADGFKAPFLRNARQALEAAAPHMEAQALRTVADTFQARLPDGTGNGRAYNSYQVAGILRSCAEDLEPTP